MSFWDGLLDKAQSAGEAALADVLGLSGTSGEKTDVGVKTTPSSTTPSVAQQNAALAGNAGAQSQTPAWLVPTMIGIGGVLVVGVLVFALTRSKS